MSTTSDVPAHRACASCRGQKVRCIIDESNPEVCQRCARSGRTCVFTPLQKRKQRKRTDTRVAELEKEMRAMRQALAQKERDSRSSSPTQSQSQHQQEGERGRSVGLWFKDLQPNAALLGQADNQGNADGTDEATSQAIRRAAHSQHGPLVWPWKYTNKPLSEEEDVIDRGLLSMATARQLFEMYRTQLFAHYPMVAIPDSVTADDMRRTKPALFLAIIAAAAGKENSELSAALDQEVLQAYATRSLVQSEKSLELVQALLVSAVWYHPPIKFGQLKYYEYIHMAATMAMDIGIGSRPAMHRTRFKSKPSDLVDDKDIQHPAEDIKNPDLSMSARTRDSSPDTSSIECRRTFVACYIICAGVSFSLRRPNMLRVSSYIRECVDLIERTPNTIPTDSTLVAWARLTFLGEEIADSFCYADPGNIASITELRAQMMLKDYEKRLSTWYDIYEMDMGTGSLLIMYYTIRLYLFEIALHVDHSPEDFRAPYQMGGIDPLANADDIPTQILAETIAQSIASAHGLLNTFLAMDVDGLRALPVFSYVRVSFANFVLAKLCLSAASPWSRIGKLVDRTSLKVDPYMDQMIMHVRNIIGTKRSRVPSVFLALLFKLRHWCLNPSMIEQSEEWRRQQQTGELQDDSTDRAVTSKQQFAIDVGGPRITEHTSSDGCSPRTAGNEGSGGSVSGLSPTVQFADATLSAPQYPQDTTTNAVQTSMDVSMARTAPMMAGPSGWPLDQMNMNYDGNIMQMLGEMNAFSEGGLTGLDDWAQMPSDFTGINQMDMMNWQMASGPNGGATMG
ncbi:hypothetical protein AC578_442 [Lecanosticta acicola]|uniref:Zn(2)-C6 fungal-type domain-containing protein n=1 Tax=Lecanosticta acicola TaxID=111012 RepID=A0AAI8Z2H2_9PEZI|nr:hypothetical protein AC578_442 [Lecanosticta acicola]